MRYSLTHRNIFPSTQNMISWRLNYHATIVSLEIDLCTFRPCPAGGVQWPLNIDDRVTKSRWFHALTDRAKEAWNDK